MRFNLGQKSIKSLKFWLLADNWHENITSTVQPKHVSIKVRQWFYNFFVLFVLFLLHFHVLFVLLLLHFHVLLKWNRPPAVLILRLEVNWGGRLQLIFDLCSKAFDCSHHNWCEQDLHLRGLSSTKRQCRLTVNMVWQVLWRWYPPGTTLAVMHLRRTASPSDQLHRHNYFLYGGFC